ncbi:MAG TPA: sugar nucleotide-binding protein [Chloroflexota bacterium]
MVTTAPDTSPQLALTGLSGFVGSAVAGDLASRFALLDLYHRTPVSGDVASNTVQLRDDMIEDGVHAVHRWGAIALINIGAAADVDACEHERDDRDGGVYRANVSVPRRLAVACAELGLRYVHVSTDYVFDGEGGPYREGDVPTAAANWYGQTKLDGERAILDVNPAAAIIRLSLPYGPEHPSKRDIVRLIRSRLSVGQTFAGVVDQFITPTWLGDIAAGLAAVATSAGTGIYHLAGATILSPYDAALIVARTFGLDERLVQPSTLAAITQAGRAPRPRVTALLETRMQREFGPEFRLKGFAEGVGLLRGNLSS